MNGKGTVQDFFTYRISILAKRLDQRAAELVESRFGLRLVDWWVLGNLSATEHQAVRDLVRNIHIDKSQISRSLARMIEQGIALKVEDVTDKRSPLFLLTPKGDKVREEILKLRIEENEALAGLLNDDEWKTLNSAINRFSRYVEDSETQTDG